MKKNPALSSLASDLKSHLASNSYRALKNRLKSSRPEDLATAWLLLSRFERVILFKLLEPPAAKALFDQLPTDEEWLLLQTLEPGALGPVLAETGPAQARELFWSPDQPTIERLIASFRRKAALSRP